MAVSAAKRVLSVMMASTYLTQQLFRHSREGSQSAADTPCWPHFATPHSLRGSARGQALDELAVPGGGALDDLGGQRRRRALLVPVCREPVAHDLLVEAVEAVRPARRVQRGIPVAGRVGGEHL